MPILGLHLEATIHYESIYDDARGKPEATKFNLGTLDARVAGRIADIATTFAADPNDPNSVITNTNIAEMRFQRVMFGLKGWSNFRDEKTGQEVAFKTAIVHVGGVAYTVADQDCVKRLPPVVLEELSERIRQGNTVTADDVKNSAA